MWDKEKRAEYMRNFRATHPDYKIYMREYRKKHRAKVYADRQAWREANRERNAKLANNWYHTHLFIATCGKKAAAANKYYPGKLTTKDVAGVIEKSGRKCHWCGRENLSGQNLTLEHLRPINDIQYLVIACKSCNSARLHLRGVIATFES